MEKTKVYNVIIMDRSGSMWSIRNSAINGYNEILGGIKADAAKFSDNQEQLITLVLFDSASIDEVYWNADPATARILTDKTYVPGACTPLYDAIGSTLTKLRKEINDSDKYSVAVTVITDGEENSSSEYSLMDVKKLIKSLTDEGWTFAYMGTDHDVQSVTASLTITNVIKFEKTEEATLESFRNERAARSRWSACLHEYDMANPEAATEDRVQMRKNLSENYYKK